MPTSSRSDITAARRAAASAFLDAVEPRLALVSGRGGEHVSSCRRRASCMRLAAHGAQVLRTDLVGTIVARTDGHRVIVDAAGDSWELPPPSVSSRQR